MATNKCVINIVSPHLSGTQSTKCLFKKIHVIIVEHSNNATIKINKMMFDSKIYKSQIMNKSRSHAGVLM